MLRDESPGLCTARSLIVDTLNLFQDNTFYLGRVGFSYRTYYQDRYVFGLGRTEDVPLIAMVELLFGLEQGARSSRPYYGCENRL